MNTGSSSATNSQVAQWGGGGGGGRTTMKPLPANRSFYCRAKCNNQENYTELLKEGVTTIFRDVYLYTDSIFCDNVILHCHIILFTGMNIIVVRSP